MNHEDLIEQINVGRINYRNIKNLVRNAENGSILKNYGIRKINGLIDQCKDSKTIEKKIGRTYTPDEHLGSVWDFQAFIRLPSAVIDLPPI